MSFMLFWHKILTPSNSLAVGRSLVAFSRHRETKSLKSSVQSPPDNEGDGFWAMWYKALIAFMLNRGGFLSAEIYQTLFKQFFSVNQNNNKTLKINMW